MSEVLCPHCSVLSAGEGLSFIINDIGRSIVVLNDKVDLNKCLNEDCIIREMLFFLIHSLRSDRV